MMFRKLESLITGRVALRIKDVHESAPYVDSLLPLH